MTELSIKLIFAAFLIIILFTIADYMGHYYLEKNYELEKVPDTYYRNKIIYGFIILILTLLIIDKTINTTSYNTRIFVISSIVVILLQLRYYYTYSPQFNYSVLVLHYLILIPLVYYFQKKEYI